MDLESRIKWHFESDKNILITDFSGMSGKLGLDLVLLTYKILEDKGLKTNTLHILSNTKVNFEILKVLKQNAKRLDRFIVKRAIVDITPIQMILLNAFLKYTGQQDRTQVFKTFEQAYQWLIGD